jgi:hypothetical protein
MIAALTAQADSAWQITLTESASVNCPEGTSGSYQHTRSHTSALPPTSWTAGDWTPAGPTAECVPDSGSALLIWQNTEPNAAGYLLSYGSTPAALVFSTRVPAGQTYTVVRKLAPGTYYFAVRAYLGAAVGTMSPLSNIQAKTIR